MASPSDGPGVLVTGCSGFTGRYLAAALQRAGYRVIDPQVSGPDFDLTRADSIVPIFRSERPEYVIHLAALSFVGHGDAAGFYAVNTVGTTNLLEAVLSSGLDPRRVVLASSANIYGNARVETISEDTPAAPVNHYAASKLAMEHMARTYADRMPIVLTRPFNYTGVGQSESFVVPKLVSHFANRSASVELGNIDVVRDFSDVRAVAEAYVRLLDSAIPGGVTNICSGTGRSLRWIIDQLTRLSGHHLDVHVNPGFIRKSDVHRLIGCSRTMQAAVGQLPHQDFSETLDWMLKEWGRTAGAG